MVHGDGPLPLATRHLSKQIKTSENSQEFIEDPVKIPVLDQFSLPASGRFNCASSSFFLSGSSTGPLIWGGSAWSLSTGCTNSTAGRSGFSISTAFLFGGLSACRHSNYNLLQHRLLLQGITTMKISDFQPILKIL